MEAQNQKKQAAADLKKNLDSLAKNGRFTVAERVNHIRKTQKVDGIEIYAVQHTTIQRAAQTDNVAGVRFFIVKGHLDNKVVCLPFTLTSRQGGAHTESHLDCCSVVNCFVLSSYNASLQPDIR